MSFLGGLFSGNSLANPNTSLYGGAGDKPAPPTIAPTVPVLVSKTSSQIIVSFNANNVNGNPVPTFSVVFGPPGTLFRSLPTTRQPDGSFQATATNLLSGVNYIFQSVATNSSGSINSDSSAVIQTNNNSSPPSSAPSVPILSTSTATSITVTFSAAGITGTDPISYSVLYGSSQTPTTSVPAILQSGTTYVATVSGLTTGSLYYFESVATNPVGSQTSAVSLGYAPSVSGVIPPSTAASVPASVGSQLSSTSFTVTFDIAGVIAQPATVNSILYGTTTTPTTSAPATLVSGTIYQAVVSGLTGGSTYYAKSVVANSGGTQTSAASAAIVLPATPSLPSAPAVPAVSGVPTSTSITVTFDAVGQTSTTPVTYSVVYGTTTSPQNTFPATQVGSTTIYQAVVTGLVAATPYYFKSVASNEIGSAASTVSAAISTAAAGGSPPSAAPTVPVVFGTPTPSSITVTLSAAGITGTAPISYSFLYGTTTTPTQQVSATLLSGTTYTATVNNLIAATPYYFKSQASNVDGTLTSTVSAAISTAAAGTIPSAPPAPVVSGTPTSTSITVTFDATGQTGSSPVSYSLLYGTTTVPTISAPVVAGTGNTFSGIVGNLLPATPYYFVAVATNSAGSTKSAVSAAISTAASAVAPSAPAVPAVSGVPTSTSITVTFDAAGQTGTAPVTYGLVYGTTTTPSTSWPVTLTTGTIYQAVLTGLSASTPYYFESVATNAKATTNSAVSAAISTASGGSPPSQAPKNFGSNEIATGSSYMQVIGDVKGVTSNSPVLYSLTYGTSSPPTTVVSMNQTVNSDNGLQTLPNLYATNIIQGLTASTSFNAFATSTNASGHIDSATTSGSVRTYNPHSNPAITNTFGTVTVEDNVAGSIDFKYTVTGSIDVNTAFGILIGYSATTLNTLAQGGLEGSGNLITGIKNKIPPGCSIYYAPIAYNGDYVVIGTTAGPFIVAGGSAPSGTVSIPVVNGTPTNTSITVVYDVSQISGTAPLSYSVLYGTTNTPTTSASASRSGNTVTAVVTGLTAATAYYFIGVVSNNNGSDQSKVSAAISTAGSSPSSLVTYAVAPFLVAGPVFNTPYTQCVNYYLGTDAVGGTLGSNGQVTGKQLFGSWYANTYGIVPPAYGFPSFSGKCLSDIDQSDTGASSYAYLHPLQTAGAKVLVSLGGYYMDMRGLWGNTSYSVPNFPGGSMPTVTQFTNSILNVYLGKSTTKLASWSNSGWAGLAFDGLNIDFENIGQGGNPNVSNSYPPIPSTAPTFPANASDAQYSSYMTDVVTMLSTIYAAAPTMILTHAPLSLSINSDSLALQGGKNVAPTTNLNQWFAFTASNVAPTTTNFNATASIALNNPVQMCYFDDIFVQFYNESPDNYLGGANFSKLLAQWAFCALKAQALGKKKTKINIGLAKGVIQGSTANPSVANSQGPTPGISPAGPGPYTYWYPQYQTSSPPNPDATHPATPTGFLYPNIGVDKDAGNLQTALNAANTLLQASGLPNAFTIQISDWCSGAGFWAGGPATAACKSVFKDVPNLPHGVTYAWSDAQYPSPDPQWAGNLPIAL